MKKTSLLIVALLFGLTASAQATQKSNTPSQSTQNGTINSKKEDSKTCVTASATILGNGVTVKACANNNNDGSKTVTTEVCGSAGLKVGGLGATGTKCKTYTYTSTPTQKETPAKQDNSATSQKPASK